MMDTKNRCNKIKLWETPKVTFLNNISKMPYYRIHVK